MDSALTKAFPSPETLVAVVAQDSETHQVLMVAWMNKQAFDLTCSSRRATYWSRSRNSLWVKGETSGNFQEVISLSFDCDRDAIVMQVKQHGVACHTGQRSCFHHEISLP